MAGHNKWSKIKRKKAREDKKKSKIFSKLIREITVAAREGGGDPEYNPRLRLAIETAKQEEMPLDNVERAIKRGTGELEGVDYEEVTYEGYGPGGVALFIEALTDNQNRAVADIRHILDTHGGNLGQAGSVAWQFERKGQIWIDAERYHEDAVFEAAIEAGAEDVSREDDEFLVTTGPTELHDVQETMKDAGLDLARAELAMVPKNEIRVEGADAERLLKLLDDLDDADDVQEVYSNADIDESVMAEAV